MLLIFTITHFCLYSVVCEPKNVTEPIAKFGCNGKPVRRGLQVINTGTHLPRIMHILRVEEKKFVLNPDFTKKLSPLRKLNITDILIYGCSLYNIEDFNPAAYPALNRLTIEQTNITLLSLHYFRNNSHLTQLLLPDNEKLDDLADDLTTDFNITTINLENTAVRRIPAAVLRLRNVLKILNISGPYFRMSNQAICLQFTTLELANDEKCKLAPYQAWEYQGVILFGFRMTGFNVQSISTIFFIVFTFHFAAADVTSYYLTCDGAVFDKAVIPKNIVIVGSGERLNTSWASALTEEISKQISVIQIRGCTVENSVDLKFSQFPRLASLFLQSLNLNEFNFGVVYSNVWLTHLTIENNPKLSQLSGRTMAELTVLRLPASGFYYYPQEVAQFKNSLEILQITGGIFDHRSNSLRICFDYKPLLLYNDLECAKVLAQELARQRSNQQSVTITVAGQKVGGGLPWWAWVLIVIALIILACVFGVTVGCDVD